MKDFVILDCRFWFSRPNYITLPAGKVWWSRIWCNLFKRIERMISERTFFKKTSRWKQYVFSTWHSDSTSIVAYIFKIWGVQLCVWGSKPRKLYLLNCLICSWGRTVKHLNGVALRLPCRFFLRQLFEKHLTMKCLSIASTVSYWK